MFCSAEILVDTRVAIEPKKASHHSLRFVSLLVCLLCQLLWKTRCARRTVDQSDGIYNSYSTVARDLWQRKPPLSSGCVLGLGSVYCHKSLAPCYNYNLYPFYIVLLRRGKLNSQFIVTARMDFQIFPKIFRFQIQYSKYTVPWAASPLVCSN